MKLHPVRLTAKKTMKLDRTRINETLTYLGNLQMGAAMSPQGVQEVQAFAQDFVATHLPDTAWHTYNTVMHTFSQRMSLGYTYVGQETVQDRKRLRAIYLLTAALLAAGNRPWGNLPLPRTYVNPATLLLDQMWKARLTWGQANGNTTPHQELLTYMRQNPALFLATNPVNIFGSTAQAVDNQGLPTDQNVLNFEFKYNAGSERYEFHPPGGGGVGALALPVASVKAVHWSAVPGRGLVPSPTLIAPASFAAIHGTELGGNGVRFMVTTQFTGCSFCFKEDANGTLYAAHISPAGPNAPAVLGAAVLAQQLDGQDPNVTAGDFANVGGNNTFNVYGRGYSNIANHATGYPLTGQMYILGFRTITGWKLYSQHRNQQQITAAPVRLH